jgi:type IV pilus assembly protein PilC
MEIFTRANVSIPLPTLILHYLGVGIRKYWFLLILSTALIVGAVKLYIETKQGKAHFDDLKLRIPVIGSLIYKTVIARFCRTLATLLKSGVSMLYALNITRDTIGNTVMAKVVNDTRKSVEEGATVTEPLVKSGKFPADVTQMIAVGEQTGRLHDMLDKIADFYDKSTEHSIKRLLTLIEPVLIIIMGGLAGFIMASMLLPLFDMVKTIQR